MPEYPLEISPVTLNFEGTVLVPSSSDSRGVDAVEDLEMDPTGTNDCSEILRSYLEEDAASFQELYFPPGKYYFATCVKTNAKAIYLRGGGALQNMGDSSVVFFSDQPLSAILWWDGTQSNSNMNGPRIEDIQFQGEQLHCAVRLTATANAELKLGFQDLRPRRYSTGFVTVQSGSRRVTGTGTSWTDNMFPAWIVVKGYPYEVLAVENPSTLTLAIAYQGASASRSEYALNWGGVGVWLEPGTDFTQYGKDWSLNGRCGCAMFASSGSTSPKFTGTSRIKVLSGYLNGEGVQDSIALYAGPFSDTFAFNVALNSYSFGVVIANGHQHDIQHIDIENAGPPPGVTGMPLEYDSCKGILVMSDNTNDGWGNRLGGYFRQCGTGIELYGLPGKAPAYTVLGVCTFRSNKANIVLGNATNTQGIVYPEG